MLDVANLPEILFNFVIILIKVLTKWVLQFGVIFAMKI